MIAPILTPFTDDAFDERLFRRDAKHLFSTPIHGVSPGGSTGEGNLIHDDELARMVEILQEENRARIPVFAGIIRQSARDAVRAGLMVKSAGADVLMVTPTQYLGGATDEGNYAYYAELSDRVGLPIVIYNVIAQNAITPEAFERIREITNVVGIKQSVGSVPGFYSMYLRNHGHALIYGAADEMLEFTTIAGGDGAIAAILSLFPVESVRVWDATRAGDHETALALQAAMHRVWDVMADGKGFQSRLKEALRQRGRDMGVPCRPMQPATAAEKEAICAALARFDREVAAV